jgi:sugar lactone lactonase YvrE
LWLWALAAPAATNNIFTVTGIGTAGFGGDGGVATSAQLNGPVDVVVTADGGYLIADAINNRVRRVSPAGTITSVAGTGIAGFSGDGGPATAAQLDAPQGVAVTADGGFLIADSNNDRVRRVSPAGTITTVAGSTEGFSGDGGPATAAELNGPDGVAVTVDGGFLIADANNHRVRRVSPAGTITTVAGNGTAGSSGDGGPASAAELDGPERVAVTADGGFLIADGDNNRVRRVSPAGTITTVAGNGIAGFSSDGGLATAAELNSPNGVTVTADGGFLIADTSNNRVRFVDADLRFPFAARQPRCSRPVSEGSAAVSPTATNKLT